MGSKTDYLENKIINHVLRNTAMTAPTTVYLALYTVTPTDSSTGTECTGGSYARVAATFAAPSGGVTSLGSTATFPTASAGWGTVVAWAVCDASTAGNLLYYGDVSPNRTVASGDIPSFSSGQVSISES